MRVVVSKHRNRKGGYTKNWAKFFICNYLVITTKDISKSNFFNKYNLIILLYQVLRK